MKNVPALILGVLVLALAGCQPRGGNIPEEALGAWEKAFNAGDAAGVAAVYAENATVMPPNVPAIKGRAAIEKFMSEGFAQAPGAKMSIASDEMFTSGGTGIRRGTYRVTGSDGTELEKGKYVEIWKKTGNKWELCIDIWNTDAPPAPPAAPAATTPETAPAEAAPPGG